MGTCASNKGIELNLIKALSPFSIIVKDIEYCIQDSWTEHVQLIYVWKPYQRQLNLKKFNK